MNDDELVESLKRTLNSRAAAVKPKLRPLPLHPDPVRARRPRWSPGRRPWTLVAAGLVTAGAAAAASVAISLSNTGHRVSTSPLTRPPSSVAPAPKVSTPTIQPPRVTTPAVTAPVTLPATPVPAAFRPVSVTFVSQASGWVLGVVPCGSSSCASLAHTIDGGKTWSELGAPPVNLNPQITAGTWIRFANQTYGWIVTSTSGGDGPSQLFYTQDGGRTWQQETPPGGGSSATIKALEASKGEVHAVVLFVGSGKQLIYVSPVDHLDWQPAPATLVVGAGPVPEDQMTLYGSSGWILDSDRTTLGGATLANGKWAQWTPPCSNANGSGLLAAASDTALVAVCNEGTWGPSAENIFGPWLYASTNGGAGFSRVAALPAGAQTLAVTVPAGDPQTVVVATASGLIASFDGGRTWQSVYAAPAARQVNFVGFTTATQAVAVEQAADGSSSSLLMSHDGGRTWSAVSF